MKSNTLLISRDYSNTDTQLSSLIMLLHKLAKQAQQDKKPVYKVSAK